MLLIQLLRLKLRSIIWRTAEKASDAAEAMKVSAQELIKIKIVDEIIKEPLGGAHRDYKEISESVRSCILKNLGHFYLNL